MNRKQRRAAQSTARHMRIALNEIDSTFDIQVDAKFGQTIMIFANQKGRRLVEDLWPDVEWTTDEKFSKVHSADWLYTHIRITKLPPHLEEVWPLELAEPDAIAFAVASVLNRRGWPLRVAYYIGEGAQIRINSFEGPPFQEKDADLALYAEYVPPGLYSRGGPGPSLPQ
jgi:hypothetical protein